nr:hypothetical protein [uncultured Dysosmobacter sp.]
MAQAGRWYRNKKRSWQQPPDIRKTDARRRLQSSIPISALPFPDAVPDAGDQVAPTDYKRCQVYQKKPGRVILPLGREVETGVGQHQKPKQPIPNDGPPGGDRTFFPLAHYGLQLAKGITFIGAFLLHTIIIKQFFHMISPLKLHFCMNKSAETHLKEVVFLRRKEIFTFLRHNWENILTQLGKKLLRILFPPILSYGHLSQRVCYHMMLHAIFLLVNICQEKP